MDIRDIVNRDNVNLDNCDQEPIHIPGTIQPHGFLLAVDRESKTIRFCSGNCFDYTGLSHEQVLDKNINAIFNEDAMPAIYAMCEAVDGKVSVLKINILERQFNFISHVCGSNLILEAEQAHNVIQNTDLVDLSRDFVTAMEDTKTLKELCDLVAINIRKVTGYDRVMVYRFDKDYNGEVISESKNEKLEGFLGLHYPHTDIPVQARELYVKNQLRIIVDMDYVPVPVYTTALVKNDALDMSYSVLRSVSPIHVQYLHNMGVGATLTISLVLRGKLWGLIACHHYSAKYLPYEVRMSAKLLGHFITSQVDSRNLNEEHEVRNKTHLAVEHFGAKKLALDRSSLDDIINDTALLSVCNADGVCFIINDLVYKLGSTPSEQQLHDLAAALKGKQVVVTESLVKTLPEIDLGTSSLPGLLYYSLQKSSTDCVMWFRQEAIHDVNWAGDPSKSIEKNKDGLSPRKSFELWRETVKNHCKAWLAAEIDSALSFVNILQRHISAVLLAEEEEKQRLLANTLIRTNAELENINYISTHDLQEPLRKIQMTASVLLGNKNENFSNEALEKISKMNQFAGRMQFLIKDILKYTQLNYNTEAFEDVQLDSYLSELQSELNETLHEKNVILEIGDLPVICMIPFLIKQLFTNLINNSIKFSDPSRPGHIVITSGDDTYVPDFEMDLPLHNYYIIKYRDNGLGFEKENNEKIFKIFTRLYTSQQVAGSGIGLAICRKIMQTHKGYIAADGEPGVGATFRIYFPKVSPQTKN